MGAFLTGLSIALILIKMQGLVHISWLLAFTPLLIYLLFEVGVFIVIVIYYIVGLYHK